MHKKVLFRAAKLFVQLSGTAPTEVPHDEFVFPDPDSDQDVTSFNSCLELLNNSGISPGFNWQAKVFPLSASEDLLRNFHVPFISFYPVHSNFLPVVIKPGLNRSVELYLFTEDGSYSARNVDLKEATQYLLSQENFKLWQKSAQADSVIEFPLTDSFLVVTGFGISEQEADHHTNLTPFARFKALLKSEKGDIVNLYYFSVMIALVNLALPLGIQAIVGLMSGGLLLESVILLIILVILATAISGWLQVKQLSLVEVLQQRIFAKTAFRFAFNLPKLNLSQIRNVYTPELVNRFFDVLNVQKALPKVLIDFVSALIQILFGLILLSFYHPSFILFGVLLSGLIVIVFYVTGKKALDSSIAESKYKYKVVYWLEELGRSLQSFKLAGVSSLPVSKTDKLLSRYLYYRRKHFKVLVGQFSAVIAFKTLITAGLLILGGALVFGRQINLGQFVASEIIIVLVINSAEKIISNISVVYDMLTALDKIGQVTDLHIEKPDGVEIRPIVSEQGFNLNLTNVSFRHTDARHHALNSVSLSISKGEKICVTGFADAGKTSLLKTMAGLFDEYEGSISINGVSLRNINRNSFRSLIGDTLNVSGLFEGTIAENIAMGRSYVGLSSILEASTNAGLQPFILGLKEGLNTLIQPGGSNLPTNICRKILLARAYAGNPELILIDEFFYSVRNREKAEMLDRLFVGNFALVIVSHAAEIMERCDKVIVMNGGKILASGLYKDLVAGNQLPDLIERSGE